ncbi:MAG: NCS2 family permease [Candidatus Latescibacteria bacterium]|nr:NCS2 family permease [Candidatus Latescibacterota bacterium]NIO01003.1 NCS2 family permease [Candidatus Latescibacterota bacterium]NIO27402.1 NCS2 family permease [Candidatus Latescibacterota bacterium]NIO54924.1 NCS2 family permease [Candidatus Latescibacterota bacterium]NIT01013.1 NCS2 family permease [Candidatus Latescibacterota bacterium]
MKQHPLFVKRDIDGFFGLAIDNLIQVLLIVTLGHLMIGWSEEFIFSRILPGVALSLIVGNLYYSRQARKLAERTGRDDVTALPYGINTVSLFAFFIFVMMPVYQETGDSELAWRVGLVACFGSGVIEFVGAFVVDWLRRVTPRAALLATLAGIAITFISMDFAFQTFEKPILAMLPLAIILIQYFSKVRFPLGLPGGLVALIAGSILAWALNYMDSGLLRESLGEIGFHPPVPAAAPLFSILGGAYLWKYLAIIIPMGLFNVIGSLQNLESAEAAGDRYETRPSLAVNGVGSIIASLFGSCFPTTIYIGHPGWKGLGARAGYSILNAVFFTFVCFAGAVGFITKLVPMEAGIAIVLWIGIVITAQAYQATPRRHAPAVAVGFIPALAAWGITVLKQALMAAGTSIGEAAPNIGINGFFGMIALERGFIFTSMILASISVFLIERDFLRAAYWSIAGIVLSFFGVIHTYEFVGNDVTSEIGFGVGAPFSIGYLTFFIVFIIFYIYGKKKPAAPLPEPEVDDD